MNGGCRLTRAPFDLITERQSGQFCPLVFAGNADHTPSAKTYPHRALSQKHWVSRDPLRNAAHQKEVYLGPC